MRCPGCGKEVRASRATCLRCGYQLQGTERQAVSAGLGPGVNWTAWCINCGNSIREGTRVCTQCGQPAEGTDECPECRSRITAIDRYCPGCGRALRPGRTIRSLGRPVAALILGIVPGLFSLWG